MKIDIATKIGDLNIRMKIYSSVIVHISSWNNSLNFPVSFHFTYS